jgi:hypothetical protein
MEKARRLVGFAFQLVSRGVLLSPSAMIRCSLTHERTRRARSYMYVGDRTVSAGACGRADMGGRGGCRVYYTLRYGSSPYYYFL